MDAFLLIYLPRIIIFGSFITIDYIIAKKKSIFAACITLGLFNSFYEYCMYCMPYSVVCMISMWNTLGSFLSFIACIALIALFIFKRIDIKKFIIGITVNVVWLYWLYHRF